MNYTIVRFKKRSWYKVLLHSLIYKYHTALITMQHLRTGIDMIWNNKTAWYYDYTNKRIMILTGLEYMCTIRIDLDEVAYFNNKNGVIRAEKF